MKVRQDGRIVSAAVTVAVGVNTDGRREVLGMDVGPSEAEMGPRWRAAQTFLRWSRGGVWERLLALVQERGVQLGIVFLDGTNMRAHQKAAGAAKWRDLKSSETLVKLLADHVAVMGRKLA